MIWFKLIGVTIALVYGGLTAFQKKTPLYYKILFFGIASCFLGTGYYSLAYFLWPEVVEGFHVGYFGTIGMFFFLYSSYYGAINSLADGKESKYRSYRMLAGAITLISVVFALWRIWMLNASVPFLQTILVIPVGATLYFAIKHLFFPDVEMGIIDAMRPFNVIVCGLCIMQLLELSFVFQGTLGMIFSLINALLLAISLPIARKGVRRWFI